jgi:hypothetical protein
METWLTSSGLAVASLTLGLGFRFCFSSSMAVYSIKQKTINRYPNNFSKILQRTTENMCFEDQIWDKVNVHR